LSRSLEKLGYKPAIQPYIPNLRLFLLGGGVRYSSWIKKLPKTIKNNILTKYLKSSASTKTFTESSSATSSRPGRSILAEQQIMSWLLSS